jgi:hypothetical protein
MYVNATLDALQLHRLLVVDDARVPFSAGTLAFFE